MTTAIWRMEPAFDALHATADEQCGIIAVIRNNHAIANERNAKLFKTPLNDFEYAERRFISLSSLLRVPVNHDGLDSRIRNGFAWRQANPERAQTFLAPDDSPDPVRGLRSGSTLHSDLRQRESPKFRPSGRCAASPRLRSPPAAC